MFDKLIEKVKAEPKTIVFTEGSDARIQEAAARLLAEVAEDRLQLGLVNWASTCSAGFQVGLVNIIADNQIPFIPIVNAYFPID